MINKYDPPINPHKLRKGYTHSVESGEIWLTAHSHRWWPDAAARGQAIALDLAYEEKDDKWDTIFGEIIPEFQRRVASRIGVSKKNANLIAHDENTFNLVGRLLSCYFSNHPLSFFPNHKPPEIVTTDGEFQSFERLLISLEKRMSFRAVRVPTDSCTLTERLIDTIDKDTSLVYVSTIFFKDGYVLQDVSEIIKKARKVGATVVLDAYHQFNNRKISVDKLGGDIFVVGGGYKGGGAGEGAAWMKIPEKCRKFQPIITGWFADFSALGEKEYPSPVRYGEAYHRFSGATRDVSGICRQLAVLEWMDKQWLSVPLLETNNHYQINYMIDRFDKLRCGDNGAVLLTSRDECEQGPFLAVRVARDEQRASVTDLMKRRHVHLDMRGDIIRLGPGPYTTKNEIDAGMSALADGLRSYRDKISVIKDMLEIL